MTGSLAMDDGGRCLLDVISDPLALEYFLGCSNEELKSAAQTAESLTQLTGAPPPVKRTPLDPLGPLTPQDSQLSSSADSSPASATNSTPAPPPHAPNTAAVATVHDHSPCPPPPGHHAPVPPPPSPAPSPFHHAPAPSPATPSPFSASSRSPMPPPPPSLSPSSMSASHSRSPSGGYPVTPSPGSATYQPVRSPAASPHPPPTSFAAVQLNQVLPSSGGAMAPATVNILQQPLHHHHHHHQQMVSTVITLPTSASPTMSTPAGTVNVGGQLMQIIQASPQSQQMQQQMQQPTVTTVNSARHHHHHVKPIQPKQQQILPKPPAGSVGSPGSAAQQQQQQVGAYGAKRSSVNIAPSSVQSVVGGGGGGGIPGGGGGANSAPPSLVLGAANVNHNVIPNANVTMGPQGTLLLNHISLGALGQNHHHHPILFPSGTGGLPPHLQLVMRPQAATNPGSQPGPQTAGALSNAALLNALQMQNHVATHQTFLPAKASGQATVVIPGNQTGAQAGGLRPANLIGGARLVGGPVPGPQLVLQQIQGLQGPYVIQTLQGTQMGALGNVIQGQTFQGASLPPGLVLNSHHHPGMIATSSAAPGTMVNSIDHQQMAPMVAQLQAAPHQQLVAPPPVPTPPPPVVATKPQSVNLEELLKQAGIVPDDSPSSPPPASAPVEPQQQQPMATYAHMAATVNGPHALAVGQDHIPVHTSSGHSPLLTNLQQPIVTSQLQPSGGALQHQQLKFSMSQDGSLYIQRPVYQTQGGALTLAPSPHHQHTVPLQPQQQLPASISVGGLSTTTTTVAGATTLAGASPSSVLMQRLGTQQQHHHQLVTSSSDVANTAGTAPTLLLQGINVNLMSGIQPLQPVPVSSPAPTPVSLTNTNAILGSVLSQTHPMLTQSLCQDGSTPNPSSNPSMAIRNRPKVAKQRVRKIPVAANVAAAIRGRIVVKSAPSGGVTVGTAASLSTACITTPSSSAPVLQRGPPVADSVRANMAAAAAAAAASAAAVNNASSAVGSSATTTSIMTAAAPRPTPIQPPPPPAPSVIMSGFPFGSLQPGQRVQTIQLTPQGQEALQKVQAQLRALGQVSNRMPTPQQVQQIHQLHTEQSKILAQGKLISVQQQPFPTQAVAQPPKLPPPAPSQHLPQPHQQQPQLQPKFLQQKAQQPVVSLQMSVTNHQMHTAMTTASPTTTQSQLNSFTNTSPALGATLMSSATFGGPTMASLQVATTIAMSQATILSSGTPSVITMSSGARHLKIGNQLIALAPHRPVAPQVQQLRSLTPEQQQQLLQQNQTKQALILKLQQQQQIQQQNQQQQHHHQQNLKHHHHHQIAPSPSTNVPIQPAPSSHTPVAHEPQSLKLANGVMQLQSSVPGPPQHRTIPVSRFPESSKHGVKRPASTPALRSSHIRQKLMEDQNAILNPDCKTPFHSKQDACKRLLQYHVFNSRAPSPEELARADEIFETFSEHLLEKARSMMTKYKMLLLKESMKENTTAEQVMLDRMFMTDETRSLERDRQSVIDGKNLELPPAPDHWLEMIKEEMDVDGPDEARVSRLMVKREKINADGEDEEDEEDEFLTGTPSKSTLQGVVAKPTSTTIVKQEPPSPSADVATTASLSARRNERGSKNYDEWAEIQRELEMYPLEENEEPSCAASGNPITSGSSLAVHMGDFECSATLSDFEPPVPKPQRTATVHSQNSDSVTFENSPHSQHLHHQRQLHNMSTSPTYMAVERLVTTPPPPIHGGLNLFSAARRQQMAAKNSVSVREGWDCSDVTPPCMADGGRSDGDRDSSPSDTDRDCAISPPVRQWDDDDHRQVLLDSSDDELEEGEVNDRYACINATRVEAVRLEHNCTTGLGVADDVSSRTFLESNLVTSNAATTNTVSRTNHQRQTPPHSSGGGASSYDDDGTNVTNVEELFNVTFRSWPPDVMMDTPPPNGEFEGPQPSTSMRGTPVLGDDDLNAQVQNAINSILNLQGIDDTCGDLLAVAAANAMSAATSSQHHLALSDGDELLLALGGGDDECGDDEFGSKNDGCPVDEVPAGHDLSEDVIQREEEEDMDNADDEDEEEEEEEEEEEVEDEDEVELDEDEDERTEEKDVEDASIQCELGEKETEFQRFDNEGDLSCSRFNADHVEESNDRTAMSLHSTSMDAEEEMDSIMDVDEGLDYEAETNEAHSDELDQNYPAATSTATESGTSEIDAALDEAVKSILL